MNKLQRVLVLGIGGIGGAVAKRLHRRGVQVHLMARSEEKLSVLSKELGGAPFTTVDVTDAVKLHDAVQSASVASPLSGIVYAVGSISLKPLKSTSAKDFIDAYTLNFLGAAIALKAAAPALAANQAPGSAVFFSSVAAAVGFPNHTAIASAKGAIEAFTRSTAAELAPKLRVNCIAPSLTDTPLASRMTSSEAMRKALADAHPSQRLGTADDSAALTEFLLDDSLSGWISGQTFSVDGGRSTLRPKN